MSIWTSFLATQPLSDLTRAQQAAISENTGTFLVDLSHQGLLAVEGPDAAKFLQGQATCDVKELSNYQTRLGAQCNIKGRMLITFRALQADDETIYLRMHKSLLESAQASLGKYIVFSKAKLRDRSEDYCRIGLTGVAAESLAGELFATLPDGDNNWAESNGNFIIRLEHQRFECWIQPDQAETFWQRLTPHCILAEENFWTLLDIRAGIGEVRQESQELFTPQALNYQLVNGVSFRKGCYTGQEIVARLHYRGTLKRHMYRMQFSLDDSSSLPVPGSEVVNSAQKNIGEIVLCAISATNQAEALAAITDADITAAYIASEPSKKLELLALPYAIPNEASEPL